MSYPECIRGLLNIEDFDCDCCLTVPEKARERPNAVAVSCLGTPMQPPSVRPNARHMKVCDIQSGTLYL